MKQEVIKQKNNYLDELSNTQEVCQKLMATKHYSNLGAEGIFAVVSAAGALGIDPKLALGGGLYFVKGKVEMSSRMMAGLIRKHKHSITRNRKSDDTICILHGKRADNGDEWSESFSIEEAKRAGICRGPWLTFPRDMLYARALSRLARQLFPDVIGNCYVEGEISLDDNIKAKMESAITQNDRANYQDENSVDETEATALSTNEIISFVKEDTPSEDISSTKDFDELEFFLEQVPDYKEKVMSFLAKQNLKNLLALPKQTYTKILNRAKEYASSQNEVEVLL
jgi:hypothetical protein